MLLPVGCAVRTAFIVLVLVRAAHPTGFRPAKKNGSLRRLPHSFSENNASTHPGTR